MTPPADGAPASRLVPLAAGLGAGATAWLSLGVLAVVEPARLTRVGALPPWEWLVALLAGGALVGWLAGRRLWLAPLTLLVLPWLPWLPVPVPGAFLLWEGPLEAAVWAAAVGGALWPTAGAVVARIDRHDRPWRSPRLAPAVAGVCSLVLALTAWTVARPQVPAGDEPHYLVITQSLLRDGDLRIENNHRDEHYLDYYDAALRPDFMRRGTDRQIYSIHAPGVSVLVLPAFAVAGYPGAVLTVAVVGALGLALVWRIVFACTASLGAAWFAWAAVGTAAPLVLHAFTIYPDPVGGALAVCGVTALVALDRGAPRWSPGPWIVTGAALAVLPWLHTRFALIAGVLGLAVALRLWTAADRRADLRRFLTVPVLSAAAWFAYFYWIYGTPNPAAPYGTRPEGGLSFVPAGAAGLLIDQQFGLVATAPVLVAASAGMAVLGRQRPRLAIELLAVVVPSLVTAASYPMWWGGYSAPARFLVALIPVLAVPLGVLWAAGSRTIRAGLLVLLAVSASITVALVGIDRGAFIYNGRDGYALLLDWLSRSADLTLALPSVHRDGPGAAVNDVAVWGVAAAGTAALAALALRLWPRRGIGVAVLSVPVTVMLASTIVWTGRGRDVVTAATSQMSWLDRWRPARAPLVLQLTPTRRLSLEDAPRRLGLATSRRGRYGGPDEPLLRIPSVPAGDYDVFVEPKGPLTGEVTVRLGRQELPMEQWRLDGRPAGFSGLVLRLPVTAHSITITGDAAATSAVGQLLLRPRSLATSGAAVALRAARYGDVVVFALDDGAFMEPGALWVRGTQTAPLVVRADEGRPAVLRLTAGPVANDVRLQAGAWTRTVSLQPRASTDVALPVEALSPATLVVTSTTGFRPAEHDGGSDVRWLGVFVTWPGEAAPTRAASQ